MSFVKELKRRNVIRVAIGYIVSSWLLLQIADLLLDIIGSPDWVLRTIALVFALGFPIVVFFSWAYEVTPEGVKRESEIDRSQSITHVTGRKLDYSILAVLVIALAYFVWETRFSDRASDAVEPQGVESVAESRAIKPADTASKIPPTDIQSIAVLPFINMSGDPDNEYFSDGLTETLLHMLAQLPELRVAARTSSFAFKGKDISIQEISKTLGVAHILEGSVQKAGDRVRITAQLIRADDGFHVWSQNYDRTLEDIFAIQDEIARDVAGVLDTTLLGGESRITQIETRNVAAYDLYLRALEQQAIFSYGSLANAESLFKQTLAIDPGFIDAKLALARNYYLQFHTGLIEEPQMRQSIAPLLSQVREIQPENRLARAIEKLAKLQTNLVIDQDTYRKELEELRLLLPLIPTESFIRGQVAQMIATGLRQPEVALEVLEAGLMIDPLSATLYGRQAYVFNSMKRFEDARDAYLRAIELNPLDPNNYHHMAYTSLLLEDITGFFKWKLKNIQADPQDHESLSDMAAAFYDWGLPEEGDRWLERVRALAPNSDDLQVLYLTRAHSRGDAAELITIAEKMIVEPVGMRRSAFPFALNSYKLQMIRLDRNEEAYEFLVGLRPEIRNFEQLPKTIEGWHMQWAIIELMWGFKSQQETKAAWVLFTQNHRANWDNVIEDPSILAEDFFYMGDLESAIAKSLEDLAQPIATDPTRGYWYDSPTWTPITSDPRVAARLSEMEKEKQLAREQIKEMLQGPEWN